MKDSLSVNLRFPAGPLLSGPADLDDRGLRKERVYRLRDAQLVFANHTLLQHDFPWLREQALLRSDPSLAKLSPPARKRAVAVFLDRWLLDHAAFISSAQKDQQEVNQPIVVTGDPVVAFRPTRYGRALVISLAKIPVTRAGSKRGLLDIKGAGVAPGRIPQNRPYRSGLHFLGDALADTVTQWVIDEIFARAATGFYSVPVYGIVSAGFGIRHKNGKPAPAGILVRRAHRRPVQALELPTTGSVEELVKLQIEMVLRRYGITTANNVTRIEVGTRQGQFRASYGKQPVRYTPQAMRALRSFFGRHGEFLEFEGINVQLTRECSFNPSRAQLVDFGHYNVRQDFTRPVASLVRDRMIHFGAAIMPDSPYFPKPNPRLALPFERWGYLSEKMQDCPYTSLPPVAANCFSLAEGFAVGRCDGAHVLHSMRAMVDAATDRWRDA